MSQHLAANEVNVSVMAYYRPWADNAVLVPLIANIHDLDFLGYIHVEISPQIQISFWKQKHCVYNSRKQVAYIYAYI